jgi:hypothetical protein
MRRVTRRWEGQTGSLHAWNMENEHTREILLTSFIICPIPDLRPTGTQAQNNDGRRSITDLRIWTCNQTSIIYRLQSHPSLLRIVLRPAYLEALHSLALLASVSQGQVSSTKAILCIPCNQGRAEAYTPYTNYRGPAARGDPQAGPGGMGLKSQRDSMR